MGRSTGKPAGRPAGRPGRVRAPVVLDLEAGDAAPPPPRVGWQVAVTTTVEGLGYELVDVERAQRGLLRITIDRVPGRQYSSRARLAQMLVAEPADLTQTQAAAQAEESLSVTVEDCEKVTRQLQYVLEVEGLDYGRLEVSSPGLDRPLKHAGDYARFAGQAVLVVLKQPFKGRKNWQGILSAAQVERAIGAEALVAEPMGGDQPAVGLTNQAWSLLVKDGKTEQVLGFDLDEVREARLVPVVNFKGRKADDGAAADAVANAPDQDGG
jgi:ribosome maturation factor RimP